jgi:hypothetical protein
MRSRTILFALPVGAVAALGLVSWGDDDDAGGTTTPAGQITNPALPPTSTDGGGGGMSAGTRTASSRARAGYGPNESDVVASIPCSGAGESSIQLRGCTEDDECAASESKTVTITG